jgi:hypothetical protein
MCGRRRLGKNFLTHLQHWSGAVTCPASHDDSSVNGFLPTAIRGELS